MTDAAAVTVRQARADDADAVSAFASDTWEEFEGGDYLPHVFPEWVESDGPDQRTFVAEVDSGDGESGEGDVVGVCQCTLLSEHEAWAQGMRVAPAHRGTGVGEALNEACFAWARERGASVCRAMVFSWNSAGLGAARGVGFEPCTEFRWARPEPDADADHGAVSGPDGEAVGGPDDEGLTVTRDPDAAWTCWARSGAREHLRGLTLDPGESWSLSEATRERFRWAADETAVVGVKDASGTRAAAFRTREYEESEGDSGETELWVEYGVGAWDDLAACEGLFTAISRIEGVRGAAGIRMLIPETVRHVSDVAYVGAGLDEEPDFVVEADLTGS